MNYKITSDSLTVTISDIGAELISCLGDDGFEYVWKADEKYWGSHSPLLFPVCGKILNNEYTVGGKKFEMRGHGFARKMAFTPTRVEKSRLTLTLSSSEETKKQYPFDFILTADFRVFGKELFVDFTVKNTGSEIMPYMLGWHPGFTLEEEGGSKIGDFVIDFGNKDSLLWYPLQNGCFVRPFGESYALNRGKYILNEEEIYSNDTLIFKDSDCKARLSSSIEKHGIDFSWSENLPYFCIWKEPGSEARFICLEPWSDVPSDGETPENFDNRKMSRLEVGKSEKYSYRVNFFN